MPDAQPYIPGVSSSGSVSGGGSTLRLPALEALKTADGLVVFDSGATVGFKKVAAGDIPDVWALKDYASGAKATGIVAGEIKRAPVGATPGLPLPQENLYWDLDDRRLSTIEADGLDCGALLDSQWVLPLLDSAVQALIDTDSSYSGHALQWGFTAADYPSQMKNKVVKLKTGGTISGVTITVPGGTQSFVEGDDAVIFYLPANATKQTTLAAGGGNFRLKDGTEAATIVFPSGATAPKIVYLIHNGTQWVEQPAGAWLKNTVYVSHHMLIAGRTGGGGIEALTSVATTDQAAYTAQMSSGDPEDGSLVTLRAEGVFDFNVRAATLAVNGGDPKAVKGKNGTALTGGEINSKATAIIRYNGTEWRVLNETRPDFDSPVTKTIQAYSNSFTTPGGSFSAGNAITLTGTWDEPGVIATKTLLGGTLFVLEAAWSAVRFVVGGWNTAGEDIDIWYKDGSDPTSIADGTQLAALPRSGASLTPTTVSDDNAPAGRRYWFRARTAGNGGVTGNRQLQITSNNDTFSLMKTVPGRFGTGLAKDAAGKIVSTLAALSGKETDRYASYNNAMIAGGYRTATWCLFHKANGPPTTATAVRQPDIADRNTNGVVAFGAKLRTDRDPNELTFAPVSAAEDYVTGQEIYVSIWNDKSAHLKITLTSGGTLVGTGDAAYIWATATWDEVNDLPQVTTFGDYMLLAQEKPTDVKLRIPSSDILGIPSGVRGDPILGSLGLLTEDLSSLSINHLERHFAGGYDEYDGYSIVAGSAYDAGGEIDGSILANVNPQIRVAVLPDDVYDWAADVVPDALVELRVDASNYILARVTSVTGDSLGTPPANSRYVNTTAVERIGSVGVGDSVSFRVYKGGGLEQIVVTSGNAKNAITGTTRNGLAAHAEGSVYLLRITRANDGAATLSLNGGAAVSMRRRDGSVFKGGELRDFLQPIFFTGAQWIMLGDGRPDFPIHEEVQKAGLDTGFVSATLPSVGANSVYTLPNSITGKLSVEEVISHKTLNGGTLATLLARFPKFGITWNTQGNNVQIYYKDGSDPSSSTDGTVQAWSGGSGNRYLDATNWPQGRRFWFYNNGGALGSGVRSIKILSAHDPDSAEAVFHAYDIGGRWEKHSLTLTGNNQDLVTDLNPDDYVRLTALSDDGISASVEGVFKDLEDRSASGVLRLPLDGLLDKYEGTPTASLATILSGCDGRDVIEAGVKLIAGQGSGNVRLASMRLRYTDLVADSWLPDNPVDGKRVMFTPSGSNLRCQTAGLPGALKLSVERRSEQIAIFNLGSSKIQGKRLSIGPPVNVDCWVLKEGE